MNSTEPGSPLARPGIYCRPALWTDLAKSFLLNYGLHAFTVLSPAGAGPLIIIVKCLSAILVPISSTRFAIIRLSRFSILKKNKLARAADAGALCMLVPASMNFRGVVSPSLINIHGHHPIHSLGLLDWVKHNVFRLSPPSDEPFFGQPNEEGIDGREYKLVIVPPTWDIQPLPVSCCRDECNVEISSNYSFLKTSAVIIQVLYGSYELYAAAVRSNQFEQYGYAAYSLTVIPYILMSFLNGLASLSRPDYPAKYLIYYTGYHGTDTQGNIIRRANSKSPEVQGNFKHCPQVNAEEARSGENIHLEVDGNNTKDIGRKVRDELTEHQIRLIEKARGAIVGAVGSTYGDPRTRYTPPRRRIHLIKEMFQMQLQQKKALVFIGPLINIAIAAPYVMIYLLTGYNAGQSTQSQRTWITSSMVLNQLFWVIPFFIPGLTQIVKGPQIRTKVPAGGGRLATRITGWHEFLNHHLLRSFLYTMVMSVPTIESFVVVGNMMLSDRVCVKLE